MGLGRLSHHRDKVSVPFGDIGSSNKGKLIVEDYTKVSVPFGDIGS
ncbi:hypothetical protein HMPREF1986_02190, partial [Oribacterium sp. oral taxon 078 str. F0263]